MPEFRGLIDAETQERLEASGFVIIEIDALRQAAREGSIYGAYSVRVTLQTAASRTCLRQVLI